MATKIILSGRVQGVGCRWYCAQYARRAGLNGSVSNLSDGTVRVLLDSDDAGIVNNYARSLLHNPAGYQFFGVIDNIKAAVHKGEISGDYFFNSY